MKRSIKIGGAIMQTLKINIPELPNRKRVLTKALISMVMILQLSHKELSAIVGLSESTCRRLFKSKSTLINPKSKEGQLALLLLRLYRNLDVLFGGNVNQCRLWLRSHNKHLNGVPLDLIKTIEGLVFVIHYFTQSGNF